MSKTAGAPSAAARITVVVLTHNRAAELQVCLEHLALQPEHPPVIVVDNGSHDGTAALVRQRFPQMRLIALDRNAGAAGRNAGVEQAYTPYVAFCDDDTWWARGTLGAAAALLDRHPAAAVLSARVLVGPRQWEDPICAVMAASPLPADDLPGPAVMGFMAGACAMRRSAFLEAGGYDPALFLGGEEALLTLDLWSLGWRIAYVPDLVVHHHPSARRDGRGRRRLLLRNRLLVAALRRPAPVVRREVARAAADCARDPRLVPGLSAAMMWMPWALRRRRVIPGAVETLCRLVESAPHRSTPSKRV